VASRIDYLIDQLFMVLPCKTYAEISDKLTRRTGTQVTRGSVGMLLSHLRGRMDEYQWTVPHVKRGLNVSRFPRFFAVLVNNDGTMDLGPEHIGIVEEGMTSTLGHAATMMKNEADVLMAFKQYITSRNKRNEWQEVIDDMNYVARKCVRIAAKVRDGTNN